MIGDRSLGGRPHPREELRMESRPEDVSRQPRKSNTNKEARAGEGSRVEILTRRLEMPIFEGWNPKGWIFRVERFFFTHGMTEEEKIAAAIISLDGKALTWFQWEDGHRPILNWEELKVRLLDRFRRIQEGTLCEQFLSLRPDGSVRDYLRTFELLASALDGVPKNVQESTFINGLKLEIRAEVRMLKPVGLREVMNLAQRVEERNTYNRASRGYFGGPKPLSSHPAQFSSQNGLQGKLLSHSSLAKPTNFKTNPNMNGLNPNLTPRNPTISELRLPSIPNPNSVLSPYARPFIQKPTTNYKRLIDVELQAKI